MIPACIFFTDVNLLVKRERERERETDGEGGVLHSCVHVVAGRVQALRKRRPLFAV